MKLPDILIYAIGFTAQILFSWRMIEQWISSEKSKATRIPKQFWTHSLIASILLFLYGWLRHDFAIILGQILTYYIYIRNIQIEGRWKSIPLVFRWLLPALPIFFFYYTFNNNVIDIDRFFRNEKIPAWLIIMGVSGQVIFTFRFVYQWLYSERKRKSMLPLGFWLISIIGCSLILVYAIIRRDPVLFIGQFFGFIIYLRNIIIIKKNDKKVV